MLIVDQGARTGEFILLLNRKKFLKFTGSPRQKLTATVGLVVHAAGKIMKHQIFFKFKHFQPTD
jgi:hypothetical protein